MHAKGHRSGSAGRLGTRTSSATKIANNLQFTQNLKELPPSKHFDKQKKAAPHGHDKLPLLGRVNSSQRVQSKEQIPPLKRGPSSQKVNGGKPKAGFTISNASKDADDDDDWVSSESGAVTPNHEDSDSDTASEPESHHDLIAHPNQLPTQHDEEGRAATPLQRVETARPAEFVSGTPRNDHPYILQQIARTPTASQSLPHAPSASDAQHPEMNNLHSQLLRLELDTTKESQTNAALQAQPSPRPSNSKRSSRPPSTHSFSGKSDVRPHPLIRGQSFGHVNPTKPTPLAPLTVSGTAPPQLSTSPANSVHEDYRNYLPSSPASTTTAHSFNEGPSPPYGRRTSVSSARSVSTVPAQSMLRAEPSRPLLFDRSRTLSTMSTHSSAALSALAHLPAVTRPPSPQSVVFFPPVNPHANIEGIHPLLPGPYLSTHMTVLARRTPLRESYDRVIRAKQAL